MSMAERRITVRTGTRVWASPLGGDDFLDGKIVSATPHGAFIEVDEASGGFSKGEVVAATWRTIWIAADQFAENDQKDSAMRKNDRIESSQGEGGGVWIRPGMQVRAFDWEGALRYGEAVSVFAEGCVFLTGEDEGERGGELIVARWGNVFVTAEGPADDEPAAAGAMDEPETEAA